MRISDITSPFRAKIIAKTYKSWIRPNEKVLDIGCGNGVVSILLKKYLRINITGCDRDKYLTKTINYKSMVNDSKLPFKDNAFDVAMFNDVLHHTDYDNQVKLIREAMRIAKKVAIFELKPTIIGKLLDYILNKIHNPRMNIPFTYRSPNSWEDIFKKNKIFFRKKTVPSPFLYPFTHIAYLLLKR